VKRLSSAIEFQLQNLGLISILLYKYVFIYFCLLIASVAMPPVILSSCPVCKAGSIAVKLQGSDYTVSRHVFEIWECSACNLRFTQGAPSLGDIGAYYQSENYISHTDTNEGIVNRLYHIVRKRTLQKKRRLILRKTGMLKGRLLDVGAGTGAFTHTMQAAHWNVTGLEPDMASRERAKQLYRLQLQPVDELFNLPAGSFDAITLWHVLEHVHDLHIYMQQLGALLKPGGCLFIAVPNYSCYDAKVYGAYWAAYDVPRHLYHFHPNSVRRLATQHALQVKEMLPMWFDSFYISMLSEQYKTGKIAVLIPGFIGLWSNVKAMLNKERCSSLIYLLTKKLIV
jgi:2-polyprenyl-3-methyl-5-hydroxy-6-metoxy-1,4-benzoquinol methylase